MAGVDHVGWVTSPGERAEELPVSEHVYLAPHLPPRDWRGALAALGPARRQVAEGWDFVLSTGAAIAVPYLAAARLTGLPAHFIESAARTTGPSLTGRLVAAVPGVRLYNQSRGWNGSRWHFAGSVFEAFCPSVPRRTPNRPLRVVVMLGTMRFTFDRLVRGVLRALPEGAELTWQVGHTEPPRADTAVTRFLTHTALTKAIAEADVVVSHAGVGSVLLALDAGRCPVVIPRRATYREHVDDHQVATASALAELGLAISRDADELETDDLIASASSAVERLENLPALQLRI
jgi:UDP-N-acetylglucosamine transferase subunit ALG13